MVEREPRDGVKQRTKSVCVPGSSWGGTSSVMLSLVDVCIHKWLTDVYSAFESS